MKYKTITLKNGARLVMITGLSTNAVTLAAFIKAGFRFDPIDKPGLAHFTEHKKTVFIVAGDIEENLIIDLLEKEYKMSSNINKESKFDPLIPQRNKIVLVHKDSSYYQTSIFIGAETVPYTSPLKPVLEIVREMLGGYFGTNLVQTLRDKGGLIYDWACYTDNFTESGYIIFNIAVSHENVYKVIPIILDEFNRLAKGDISDEEIEIAKGHLIGSIYANLERNLDYVDWYGMQELLNPQNVLSVEEQIKVYKSIGKKVIKRIASKYLNKSKILVGVIGKADESSIKNLLK